MTAYVVEGIFMLETDAEDSRSAQYKAREILANKDIRIYIVNVWEKKEGEYGEE